MQNRKPSNKKPLRQYLRQKYNNGGITIETAIDTLTRLLLGISSILLFVSIRITIFNNAIGAFIWGLIIGMVMKLGITKIPQLQFILSSGTQTGISSTWKYSIVAGQELLIALVKAIYSNMK